MMSTNKKGLILVIFAVVVMIAVIPMVINHEVSPTVIELDEDSLSVSKADYSMTVLLEDIEFVKFDEGSILIDDLYIGTQEEMERGFWDLDRFRDDVQRIMGHSVWVLNTTSNDGFGEGMEASATAKMVGPYGSDLFLVYRDNPSLITIKTDYGRYLFFNTVSAEDTEAVYDKIVRLLDM